jgi:glycosyltransferase involved in cell wall biosynthesis
MKVIGGQLEFLQPILDKLPKDIGEDTVWIEWANDTAIKFTTEHADELKDKNVIVRLHAIEAYMGWYLKINWSVVNHLVVVSEHIKRAIITQIPSNVKIHVIPNAIDLDKWTYKCRNHGKNIAIVGHLQFDKGSCFVPHIMALLPDYTFHVAGQVRIAPTQRDGEYFYHNIEPFKDRIVFHGHQVALDEWYEKCSINYLLCPSMAESFNVSIGEAMAKGIKPIISNFLGAKEIWPQELVYNTLDKIPNILSSKYDSEYYRDFVKQHYDINLVVSQIKELIK